MSMHRSTIRWVGLRPDGNFTIIPNTLIRDPDLKPGTKCIAVYMWSLGDGWHVSAESIRKKLGMGKRTVDNALKELIDQGWLRRETEAGPNGGASRHTYIACRAHKIGQVSVSDETTYEDLGSLGAEAPEERNSSKRCPDCGGTGRGYGGHAERCPSDPWGQATPY